MFLRLQDLSKHVLDGHFVQELFQWQNGNLFLGLQIQKDPFGSFGGPNDAHVSEHCSRCTCTLTEGADRSFSHLVNNRHIVDAKIRQSSNQAYRSGNTENDPDAVVLGGVLTFHSWCWKLSLVPN